MLLRVKKKLVWFCSWVCLTVLHPTGRMWNASFPVREPSKPGFLLQPEAREHKLETCRSDLDRCHSLEAEKNGPLRKDREKGRDTCN